jgi:ParB family transcriptional regulator, chromosome partitioning protein
MIGIAWLATTGGSNVMEKRRLGRGLDALLGGTAAPDTPGPEPAPAEGQPPAQLPVDQIRTNPHQPRKDFDPEELAALQQSLQTHGLVQPIVVRSTETGYELVAGERRLRAAKECGWKEIPVRVVDYNDQQQFEIALVENLQRADLNPIEKAQGFDEYMRMYGVTQEEVARKMGLDRSTISNLIRLLELPESVQDAVRLGQISNGHARALLAFEDADRRVAVCREIIAKGLSVRAVEAMTQEAAATPPRASRPSGPAKTRHVQAIEDELKQALATKVEIRLKERDRGQIVIEFDTNEEFERLVSILGSDRILSR